MYSVLFSAMNMLMVWRYIKTLYNNNNNNILKPDTTQARRAASGTIREFQILFKPGKSREFQSFEEYQIILSRNLGKKSEIL